MIAEAGLAALWLAAAMAALQLGLACGMGGDDGRSIRTVRAVALAQGVLTLFAFTALIKLFLNSDMSVLLVAENSHSQKPWIYKFSGAWGNHEGSMLLWVAVLAAAGAVVALLERRLDEPTLGATLGAQAALALGFFAFLLFASNPFERISPAPIDGRGLNPLLQDPGLAFHPPTLYLGYVGLSVAFSLAVGGLVRGNVGPAIARAMRPWVLAAWVLLTLGITAGSYWAYYELGWGGWWFWDPVENASLMPWLAATALLHSLNVLAARGGLRAWTMMLALVAFSMSMVGTFLVRSGILTSVHSFAVDPTRGTFILMLLGIYIGGALTLFALRIAHVKEGAPFEVVSREGGLVLNNLILSVILGIVLVGTLYPLIAEALSGQKLSVGPPYFNSVASPLALGLAALMMIAPQLRWRRDATPILPRLAPGLLIGVVVLLVGFILWPTIGVLPRIGLAIGAGLVPASLQPLIGRSIRRTPLAVWGMAIAHLGVAIAILGMASDSAFTREKLVAASPGQKVEVGPWLLEFRQVMPVAGPNWTAIEGELFASKGSGVVLLKPQSRFFPSPPTTTNEAAIDTSWNGQLYAVLGERDEQGRGQLRLWWKPFVTLIWFGGALIALGGALALVGRLVRERRQRIRGEEAFT